jgi:hypothetical protein
VRVAEAWRVALDALRANRMRSALTMLGVIIGVASVVLLVAIGTGTKQKVEQQVEGLGSNLLLVVPGRIDVGTAPVVSPLTLSDVDAVSRVVGDPSRVAVTIASGATARAGNRSDFTTVQGVLETTRRSSPARSPAAVTSPAPTWTPAAGWRCSATRWPARSFPTGIRSASRSRSPASGSG